MWDELYKRCQINKNGDTPDWTNVISTILAEALPFCCIDFKRHKIYRKGNRIAESLMTCLKMLKSKYNEEFKCMSVAGFIQFISCDPLTIGLWCGKDVELFRHMVKSHSMLVDATGTIAIKVNNNEIFYFSFLFFQ